MKKKDALGRDLGKAKDLAKGVMGGSGGGKGFIATVRDLVSPATTRQNGQYDNKKQRDNGGKI